jgi:hypothetical protein
MSSKALSLQDLPYLGPCYAPKKTRELLPLHTTPSTIPSLFLSQEPSSSIKNSFEKGMKNLKKKDIKLIRALEKDVKNHVYLRFQLFHLQLLLVYETKLTFRFGKALSQAGLPKKEKSSIPLAEAHDATLPCLLYKKKGKEIVFGQGSYFYDVQNMTMRLPESVNKMDTWIDTTTKDFDQKSLRDRAIQIINKTSQGKLTPREALKVFLQQMHKRIKVYQKKSEEGSQEKLISDIYKKTVIEFYKLWKEGDEQEKLLCFAHRIQGPVNKSFYRKVQAELQKRFSRGMAVQDKLEKFSALCPLSDVQKYYAKTALCDADVLELTKSYFKNNGKKKFLSDCEKALQTKCKKTKELSNDLQKIIKKIEKVIFQTYQKNPQGLEKIVFRTLFEASLPSSPEVTDAYMNFFEKHPLSLKKKKISTSKDGLTKTQSKYAKTFLSSENVRELLEQYHEDTADEDFEEEFEKVASIKPKKMDEISGSLRKIVKAGLKILGKKSIRKLGRIVQQVLKQTRPQSDE